MKRQSFIRTFNIQRPSLIKGAKGPRIPGSKCQRTRGQEVIGFIGLLGFIGLIRFYSSGEGISLMDGVEMKQRILEPLAA